MRARQTVSAPAVVRPIALGWASLLVLGLAAAACTATGRSAVPASGQAATVTQAIPPGLSVSCAPGQRTLVRQTMSNGQPLTDVQCVSEAATVPGAVGYAAAGSSTAYPQGVMPGAMTASPVPYGSSYPTPAVEAWTQQPVRSGVRTVAYRTDGDTLTYQPRAPRRVVRQGRSWKKSAVIVGSSAGLGAGIGAAIGGKKGALIGAALGGGSAAIWDQATRR